MKFCVIVKQRKKYSLQRGGGVIKYTAGNTGNKTNHMNQQKFF